VAAWSICTECLWALVTVRLRASKAHRPRRSPSFLPRFSISRTVSRNLSTRLERSGFLSARKARLRMCLAQAAFFCLERPPRSFTKHRSGTRSPPLSVGRTPDTLIDRRIAALDGGDWATKNCIHSVTRNICRTRRSPRRLGSGPRPLAVIRSSPPPPIRAGGVVKLQQGIVAGPARESRRRFSHALAIGTSATVLVSSGLCIAATAEGPARGGKCALANRSAAWAAASRMGRCLAATFFFASADR
jgi:hypothetical protein